MPDKLLQLFWRVGEVSARPRCIAALTGSHAGVQFMKEEGPQPDEISYNAALNVCGAAGQPRAAETLLREMRSHGLEPGVVAYGAVLDACAKAADVGRARAGLAAMEAAGVPPNVVAYTSAMDACVRDGSDEALSMVLPLALGCSVVSGMLG